MLAAESDEGSGMQPERGGCDLCHRDPDQYIHVEHGGETVNLCSWICLIGYAAVKSHERLNAMEEQLQQLVGELDDKGIEVRDLSGAVENLDRMVTLLRVGSAIA